MPRGIVGRISYLRSLLARYGPYETLDFVICEELGLRDVDELSANEEHEDEPDEEA